MNVNLSALPTAALVAVAVLIVIQVTLDVIVLVDLYRRPADRVVLGNKWIWVAIVLLVSLFGAIIYLAAGRKPAALAENALPYVSPSARAENVADSLYGPRDEADRR